MSNWTKAETILLIELWEQLPCLYDTKHALYSNKHARNDALGKLVNDLGKFTKDEIKSKLSTLRSNYNHEIKKIRDSKKSGAGADDIYSPTVFWFDLLNFLEQHIKSRPGKSNIPTRSQSEEEFNFDMPSCTLNFLANQSSIDVSSLDELIEEDLQNQHTKKSRKHETETDPLLSQASKMMESLNKNILNMHNSIPNEYETFGKLVTTKLKKIAQIDCDISIEAQQQIMEVLFVMERRAAAKILH